MIIKFFYVVQMKLKFKQKQQLQQYKHSIGQLVATQISTLTSMDCCSGLVSVKLSPSTYFQRDYSLLQLNQVGQLSVTDKSFNILSTGKHLVESLPRNSVIA